MAENSTNDNHQGEPRILTRVVKALCADYYDDELCLNHLHDQGLPSREAILRVLELIKDVLFPDHRLDRQIRTGQTGYIVGGILEKIHEELRQQICLAHSYGYCGEAPCPYDMEQADNLALEFIERLPQLRRKLNLDAQAALDGDPAAQSFDEIIFCYPGYEAVTTYRIAHELYLLGVPLLPRIMTENGHHRTGTDIHPGAVIGDSFFIDHATGVVIGQTTLIGDRVKLYQGVTLGALSFPKDAEGRLVRDTKRHPTIEDGVVIYAGATVLGGDTVIGRGAVIGGSCWITHSIPAGTKVLLQEPQMKFSGSEKPRVMAEWTDWVI